MGHPKRFCRTLSCCNSCYLSYALILSSAKHIPTSLSLCSPLLFQLMAVCKMVKSLVRTLRPGRRKQTAHLPCVCFQVGTFLCILPSRACGRWLHAIFYSGCSGGCGRKFFQQGIPGERENSDPTIV